MRKCVIKVLSGKLSEPTKQELKVLGQEKIHKGYRLSCQTNILEDSVIEIINDNRIEAKDKIKVKKDNDIKSKENNKVLVKKNIESTK